MLVAVGDRVVCTGFVIAPTQGRDRRPIASRAMRPAATSASAAACPRACGSTAATARPRAARRSPPAAVCQGVGASAASSSATPHDATFGSRAHDYAVLTTAAGLRLSRRARSCASGRRRATDGQLAHGHAIKLAGYPADPRFADMNGLNLWRSQGEAAASRSVTRPCSNVTGFVAQGMSGGPVWRTFGADSPCGSAQCVVGILTECAVNGARQCKLGDSLRRAVRITPTVREVRSAEPAHAADASRQVRRISSVTASARASKSGAHCACPLGDDELLGSLQDLHAGPRR